MKKRQLLALGLLCGVMLPLSTGAIENGIYKVEGGHHTIIWNDDRRGNIEITIASGDLGDFYRGFNEKYDNSEWIGGLWDTSNGTGTYYSGDKMYGNTNTVNNARGGAEDNVNNGFNSGLTPERQGPCKTGRHVPSRGERNSLIIALCNINSGCNARYSDEEINGKTGNLIKANDWTEDNKLINMKYHPIVRDFLLLYGLDERDPVAYWSSSPGNSYYEAYGLYVWEDDITPETKNRYRSDYPSVLCFKDSITYPQTFKANFLNDGEIIWSGELISGSKIPEEIINTYLSGLTKPGYNFSGWVVSGSNTMFDVENDVVTTGVILNAVREIINYEIKYELDGGINSENNTGKYTIETPDITLENPTKDGYNFDGWFTDTQFTTGVTTIPTGTTGNITLYAKWTKIETKPSGGSSGGGGRSRSSNDSQISPDPSLSRGEEDSSLIKEGDREAVEDLDSNTPMDSSISSQNNGKTYSTEFQEAYEFAKGKGITTMPTIQEAQMDGKLTRIAMAKMLSQYAMNVLGQKPANIVTPKFNDVTDKQNSDYDDGVTLAYQLGIMGQNMPNNKFRPNDEVTRAEFATALSRMIYHTSDGEYKSTPKYYVHHMEKLVKEGIITNDNPRMKELRGYVMIMLMRSAEK